MTYTYKEFDTEQVSGGRWYHTPKGAYPSITTILGTTAPEEMKQALKNWQTSLGAVNAAAASKKATDHGTTVHLLCERYLKKQDVFAPISGQPIAQPDIAAFRALKLKLDKVKEVWGQECVLYSDELEVCGRADLVGVYGDEEVIVDFKTSSRIKSDKDIADYKLQLCFYAHAHNEMFGTNITRGIILMVAQTGFPMEFRVDLPSQLPELRNRIGKFWIQALNTPS